MSRPDLRPAIERWKERVSSPATGLSTSGGDGGTYDPMGARVSKLEGDMNDVRVMLARIDERTSSMASTMASSMATKADLVQIETKLVDRIGGVESVLSHRIGKVEGGLDGKLGYWQFVTTGGGLVAALLAVLTFIIRWPEISSAIGL